MGPDRVESPPLELRLAVATYMAQEKRQYPRRESSSYLSVLPLDEQGNQLGSLMIGHCVDVSEGGIRICISRESDAPYFRIEPVSSPGELGFESIVFKVLRRSEEKGSFIYVGHFAKLPGAQKFRPNPLKDDHYLIEEFPSAAEQAAQHAMHE